MAWARRPWRTAAALAMLASLAGTTRAGWAQRYVPGSDPALPRIRYADSLDSRNDRCIVAGNRLNLQIRPTYVNGLPIGFCCSRCPGIFAHDPERYLRLRGVRLPSELDAGRPARIDPAYRARVNHEIYYFADSSLLRRFQAAPGRSCGIVTDPVSRRRFRPGGRSPRTDFRGRPYFFENRTDLELFSALPDSFADRRGK
jgi:YHS domain-containing protein